ncbi:MAG: Ig-like domain-containing protein, partial [Chloroflexi bacterium]|nr:Ig-like domain-containing protein [Chloroflexota bacterium]
SPFSVAFSTGDALRVLSHAPWNGTTGVPANGLIAVTFNHPMVGLAGLGSGTPGTPRVPAGWSVSIRPGLAGNGSWLGTSTWVFHPSNGLEPSTWYTVSLGGSARDASGEPLGRGLRWSFRTVTPEVFSRSPSRGESFADPRRPIRVTFNQPMDRAATDAAFSLSTGGAAVPGSISWQGTTLVFRPGATLAATGPYTVAIGPSARSANGAATLGRRVRWQFRAAPPPAVTATDPGQGGTAYDDGYGAYTNTYGPGVVSYPGLRPPYDYGVTIDFDTPMSKLSLDRHLAIEPAVARFDTTFGSGPDDSLFAYGVYGDFKPSTQYTVTIKAKARDQFGRPLPSSYTLRFRTSRLHPSVALYGMPSEEGISFSAGRVIDAPVQLVNVPRVTYTLVRTTLQALASVSCCSGALTPPYGTRVRTWTEQIPHPLNRVQNQGVHLAQKDGSPLAAGLYWLGASAPGSVPGLPPNSPAPASWEIVAVTNTGLTLKTGSNGTLVWATSAQSGQPASGLRVRLVDYQGNIVATGTTNGNGLHFFRGYVSNQGPLSAVVDDHVHFGIVRCYWSPDLSPAGDFPHFWWWPAGPSSNGTYLYTDRPVYRPGQRVHFRALLWRDRDGVYGLYGQKTVVISASDATGRPLYRAQVSLDRFGAVHGSFDLPGTTPTGSDYLSVYMPNRQQGGVQVSASFLVAEYRKPEFLTTVTPARPSYVQRQTATATVGVEYVFGVPVANQQVSWVAYAWPQLPSPPGWDAYTFADWEDFWNQTDLSQGSSQAQSQLGVQVAQGTGRTDARGRLTIRLPVDLAKQKFDRTLTIEATTTDINHQSVSGRAQLAEYRSGLAIGLSAEHQVIPAGQQAAIDVVAVKQDGTPVPNAPLTATIYNRTYTSRLVNNGSGQSSWQAVPHDTPVETRSLSSDAGGKATLTFTPKDGGEYRVVVEGKDELGNATSTAISISASAAGFSDWGLSSDISLALKPDKTTYRVGDTAHILVPAPFDHATALITLERGTIRKYWVQHLVTNSSTVDVPITLDDLPNVYVGVALYRGWRDDVPGEGKGASPPDWRYGSADLHVSVDPRHLIVHLQQSGSRHHPGDPVTYVVTTTDQRGRSVSAQVSLALVDTAVLALQDESNPDILAALYSDRPLGVSTASDGVLSVDHLQTAPSFPIQPVNPVRLPVPAASVPKPGGGGGGPAIPPAVTVRSRFADTAYWSGGIVTDRSGRGVVHLTLPDNATTWRLDVRGLTADQRVGQAQLRTLATQDLVLRPVLPRFLLEGDRLQLGTVLNNNLRRPVSVRVSLAARGLSILSRPDSALTVPARGERLLFWRVSVPVGSRARL